jgi:hypothetical protein
MKALPVYGPEPKPANWPPRPTDAELDTYMDWQFAIPRLPPTELSEAVYAWRYDIDNIGDPATREALGAALYRRDVRQESA